MTILPSPATLKFNYIYFWGEIQGTDANKKKKEEKVKKVM